MTRAEILTPHETARRQLMEHRRVVIFGVTNLALLMTEAEEPVVRIAQGVVEAIRGHQTQRSRFCGRKGIPTSTVAASLAAASATDVIAVDATERQAIVLADDALTLGVALGRTATLDDTPERLVEDFQSVVSRVEVVPIAV